MTRIFTTGAEELNPEDVWDGVVMNNVEYVPICSTYNDIDMVWAPPRTGVACYRCVAENQNGLKKGFPDHPTELYVGLAVRFTSYRRTDRDFLWFGPGGLGLFAYTDDTILVKRGSTTLASGGAIVTNTWHYLEVYYKPLNSDGNITVKMDGSEIINYDGDTTDSSEYIDEMKFRSQNSAVGYPVFFDDIVINDTAGSVNNSWPGQVRLLPIHGKANGDTNEWSRVQVDLGANFAQARADRSADFAELEIDSAEKTELYDMEVPDLPAGATITNIIASIAAKVETGSSNIAMLCNPGVATDEGTSQALVAGYKRYDEVWDINPDTEVAWVEADLSGLQLGIISKASS